MAKVELRAKVIMLSVPKSGPILFDYGVIMGTTCIGPITRRGEYSDDRRTYRRHLQRRVPDRTKNIVVPWCSSTGSFPGSKREPSANDGKRPAVRAANAGGGSELAKDADGARSAHFTRRMDLAPCAGARRVAARATLAGLVPLSVENGERHE